MACAHQVLADTQIRDQRQNGSGKNAPRERQLFAVLTDQFNFQASISEHLQNIRARKEAQMRAVKQPRFLVTPASAQQHVVEQGNIAHVRDAYDNLSPA